MTERTYKKDLEVINLVIYCNDLELCLYLPLLPPQWFRDEVSKEDNMPEETLTLLFSHIDPLYELHAAFLKDIEQRMATWWVNIGTMESVWSLLTCNLLGRAVATLISTVITGKLET